MSYRQQVFYGAMSGKPKDQSHPVMRDLGFPRFPKRKRVFSDNSHKETQVASVSLGPKSPTKIWIIGASQICRAEPVALKKYGDNFGLDAQVLWFGKGGMGWGGVLPRFYKELSSQSAPDVLVLHAGGNDLGQVDPNQLVSQMERDMRRLQREFPKMKIVFSCLHERQSWRYGSGPSMNKDRKLVNRKIRDVLGNLQCGIIEHKNIRFFHNGVFVPDGVHFTQNGNEIFLNNIYQVVKKVLRETSKPEQDEDQRQTNQGQTSQVHQRPSKRPRLPFQNQDLRMHIQRKRRHNQDDQDQQCQDQQCQAKRPRVQTHSTITDLRMLLSR